MDVCCSTLLARKLLGNSRGHGRDQSCRGETMRLAAMSGWLSRSAGRYFLVASPAYDAADLGAVVSE